MRVKKYKQGQNNYERFFQNYDIFIGINFPLTKLIIFPQVKGKYANDDWLGKAGDRTQTNRKEWPVAYHGTLEENAQQIAREGFNLAKGVRFSYGKGIYCTPNPQAALDYATHFTHKVIFFGDQQGSEKY